MAITISFGFVFIDQDKRLNEWRDPRCFHLTVKTIKLWTGEGLDDTGCYNNIFLLKTCAGNLILSITKNWIYSVQNIASKSICRNKALYAIFILVRGVSGKVIFHVGFWLNYIHGRRSSPHPKGIFLHRSRFWLSDLPEGVVGYISLANGEPPHWLQIP